jgi:hypothetical protein
MDVRKLAEPISAFAFCVVVAFMARTSYRNPVWNFDGIIYLSAALSWTVDDPAERHRRVFDEFRREVPQRAFDELTTTSDYRRAVYASPTALATQLGFCLNRPAYVAAIAALHGMGVNGARASRLVSCAGFLAVALVFLVGLRLIRAGPIHHLAAAALLVSSPIPEIASMSDPDMIGAAPIIAGAMLMLVKDFRLGGLYVASAAILFRPDAGILVLLLLAWATFFAPSDRVPIRRAAIIGACVLVASIVIPRVSGGAPVRVFHRFYFESRLYEPARMHEEISWSGYVTAFWDGLKGERLYYPSVLSLHLALAAVASAAVLTRRDPSPRPMLAWFALAWLYVPLHYIVFPDPADRYFAPTYLLVGLAAICHAFAPAKNDAHRDEASPRAASG